VLKISFLPLLPKNVPKLGISSCKFCILEEHFRIKKLSDRVGRTGPLPVPLLRRHCFLNQNEDSLRLIDRLLPDGAVGRLWMERQRVARRRQQSQPCTYPSHCQSPTRQFHRLPSRLIGWLRVASSSSSVKLLTDLSKTTIGYIYYNRSNHLKAGKTAHSSFIHSFVYCDKCQNAFAVTYD